MVMTSGAVNAQGKSPAPEFAVEMSFQEAIARMLSQACPLLDFDHRGFDRHFRAMLGEYSDRGHHTRRIGQLFAPVQPERYTPYFEAFLMKYDLVTGSASEDFCAAGLAEAEWRTPIGRMLKSLASK